MRTITIPFTISKVDEDQRRVWGIATSDALDSQGDVLDYPASKKAVADWMKIGNIREMHDSGKAIGKAFEAEYDDVKKRISIGAYISKSTDGENTWQKVKEGILTGFSVGGAVHKSAVEKVVDRVKGVEKSIHRITDWSMSELSLVDNPANPEAQIVMVKSKDGAKMDYIDMAAFRKALDETLAKRMPKHAVSLPVAWWVQKFQNPAETAQAVALYKADQVLKMQKRDFTDKQRQDMADKGQAMPDGSFPIANKKDLANAVTSYGRAKDPAKAKAHIISRAKDLGLTSELPEAWNVKAAGAPMQKDFNGAAMVVNLACQLAWYYEDEMREGDSETCAAIQNALTALKAAAESELNEVDGSDGDGDEDNEGTDGMMIVIEDAQKVADLVKAKQAERAKVKKGGVAVFDGDPRDSSGNTAAEVTGSSATRGGTAIQRKIYHKDGTYTLVTKALADAGFTAEQAALIEKLTTITPQPNRAPKRNNPAADEPEDERKGDQGNETLDAPTEQSRNDKTGNMPAKGENSDADISDSADGDADAPSPAGKNTDVTGTAADPKAAEAAGKTSDTPRAGKQEVSTTTGDAGVDAPSPTTDADRHAADADNEEATEVDEDEDPNDQKDKLDGKGRRVAAGAVATLQKQVTDLTVQIKKMQAGDDLAKSIAGVGETLKKVADQMSNLDGRLSKIEKTPVTGKMPFSAAYPVHEVVKGEEHLANGEKVAKGETLSEGEIVSLLKRAKEYEAHPNMGSEQERGEVFRKLWKVKDLSKYQDLIK